MATTPARGLTHVAAPTPKPVEGGIFDAAQVVPLGAHEAMGVTYEQVAAGVPTEIAESTADCIKAVVDRDEFEGFTFVEGDPAFYIFAGVTCNAFQSTDEEYAAKAGERLDAFKHLAVERHLWTNELPELATDIHPAGAVKPKVGLGLLEEHAGLVYPFVPTVHFGRRVAVFLAGEDVLSYDAGDAALIGGAQISNGAGYVSRTGPGGVEAAEGEAWMYVTGQVVLREGALSSIPAHDPQTNTRIALAVRPYVVTIDGFAAAIRITLE